MAANQLDTFLYILGGALILSFILFCLSILKQRFADFYIPALLSGGIVFAAALLISTINTYADDFSQKTLNMMRLEGYGAIALYVIIVGGAIFYSLRKKFRRAA